MRLTDSMIEEGKHRLYELLPEARRLFEERRRDISYYTGTAVAKGTMQHVREENFDALVVYEGPKGGWHADLLLKKVPPGFPSAMGTPTNDPKPTREAAVEAGKHLLVMMLLVAEENKAVKTKTEDPVFEFFDVQFTLLGKHMRTMQASDPVYFASTAGRQRAMRRLHEVTEELNAKSLTPEIFKAWNNETRSKLMAVITMAAMFGCFRYPEWPDLPPKDERH